MEQTEPVKRGVIHEFSAESRRRLLQLVNRLNAAAMGLPSFMTLTYPAKFTKDGRESKAHLHALQTAFKRQYGEKPVIWKMEFQRRGAIHYHCLVWGVEPGREERAWLSATWYRIVASGDEKHLRAGTQWNPCESWRQVIAYTSKYLGKVQSIPDDITEPGRIWGVWEKQNLQMQAISEEIPSGSFHRLRRVLRRYVKRVTGHKVKLRSRWSGLTIYVSEDTGARLVRWAWNGAWET